MKKSLLRLARGLTIGFVLASTYWLVEGHDLRYEVRSSTAHDEPFPRQGRILISATVGLLLAGCFELTLWAASRPIAPIETPSARFSRSA